MNPDYIIVGGGTAGCVLAGRLSEDRRHSVCLLEAGPSDDYLWIHIPIGYAKTMFHPVYNYGYYTEPDPYMNDRKIYWPRGRCLGGSSSINGLIHIRGQAADYDRWSAAGNPGWSWREVLPWFVRSEHNDDRRLQGTASHGTGGPLWATSIPEPHPLMEAIIAAGEELGVPRTIDFNAGQQEGVGYYQLFTRNGWRCSTAVAYLRPARRRRNLRVEVDAQVTRVLFEGTRAVGVEYVQRGVRQRLRANREVLLAAGALQSPQILMLSGIGPQEHLREHGIAPRQHLPGVGRNLQDHLQLRLMFKVKQPITTNDDLRSPWRKFGMGWRWITRRSGPLAIGINHGGLFTRVLPESTTPDIQFHFAALSAELAGAATHPWSGCTFSVCQLRPESRGEVRLGSADALAAPLMRSNYLSHETDRRCAIAAVRYARRLARAPALEGLIGEEYRPGDGAQSDDEMLGFARQYGATIFHPAGTCKMAPASDPDGVVDATLRVRGVHGLRVIDASIMPTLVSGNTNAPIVMIAEKAAAMIAADAL
ncbi:MAG: GMC family oxidoreductase N-terminal domain-containing protein [Burkholderiales bacterium]|nr:GMC family oxidoreductase N-terminal domain-containing protein [Burkholderiales bacterium]